MTLSVLVPDSLYRLAAEIAERESISVEQLVSSALAEQLAAWQHLDSRAARASEEKFLTALNKVPDVEPEALDRL